MSDIGKTVVGRTSYWRHGKTASFGVWAHALKDARLRVLLYKGFVVKRTTTFVYEATTQTTGEGAEKKTEVILNVLQKIKPTVVEVPSCGATIAFSEFPIVVFAADKKVVYTDTSMKSFKAFGSVDDSSFYTTKTAPTGSAAKLPEIEKKVYSSEDGAEDTKVGLLVPLFVISARKTASGDVVLNEVLDVRTFDDFRVESKKEEEEEKPGDCCDEDGGGGVAETGGGGSGGGMNPEDETDDEGFGEEAEAEDDSAAPCPGDDEEVEYED